MRQTNEARSAITKQALMHSARAAFIDGGYSKAATPGIVRVAGVTRGALYHHFGGKIELFRAVVEAEAADVANAIESETADASSPRQALLDGAFAYFHAMAEPGRSRLLLVDGPAVLGVNVMDEIDRKTGREGLRKGLQHAIDAGKMETTAVGPLAAVLSAAFEKAALQVSAGGGKKVHAEAIRLIICSMVEADE